LFFFVSSFRLPLNRKRETRDDENDVLPDETVVKKTRVALVSEVDELELFDDDLWEEVEVSPKSQAPQVALQQESHHQTATSFAAYSRGAPPLVSPTHASGPARRTLLKADFGLNVKEEMEEWKSDKCPWLNDVRDASLRRPGDEGYDKSTVYITKEQMRGLTVPQQQYWNVKSRYFDWIVWFQVTTLL
jgi:hypothetical protein